MQTLLPQPLRLCLLTRHASLGGSPLVGTGVLQGMATGSRHWEAQKQETKTH